MEAPACLAVLICVWPLAWLSYSERERVTWLISMRVMTGRCQAGRLFTSGVWVCMTAPYVEKTNRIINRKVYINTLILSRFAEDYVRAFLKSYMITFPAESTHDSLSKS